MHEKSRPRCYQHQKRQSGTISKPCSSLSYMSKGWKSSMKCSGLSAEDREYLDALRTAKQNDFARYVSVLALLLYTAKPSKEDSILIRSEIKKASRRSLKRAIKVLWETPGEMIAPEEIEGTVDFIRREFLRKKRYIHR